MSDNRPMNRALAAAQFAKDQQRNPPLAQDQDVPAIEEQLPVVEELEVQAVEQEEVVVIEDKKPTPPQSVFLNKTKTPPTQKFNQKSPPVIVSGLGEQAQVEQGGDPHFTKVDISISGTPHRINCPTSDVINLNRTADQINEALRDIRRAVRGKSPSNEELLVLHCLDLYDQLRELNMEKEHQNAINQRASALLDKILKDVGGIGGGV